MNKEKQRFLQCRAQDIRITGLKMVQGSRSGHLGGAFSMAELMAVLYFDKMNVRPEQPDWAERDRFVLSKGHCTVALYPTLAMRGFFPAERLQEFRKIDGHLSGHAEMRYVPARSARASQPLSAWRSARSSRAIPTRSMPSWVTVRSRRGSSGRHACTQVRTNLET